MSIEDLLAEEPLVSVYVQPSPGAVDAAGLPLNGPIYDRRSVGRVMRPSAHEKQEWSALGIEVSYVYLTQDTSITFGEFLLIADGRLFRIVGTGQVVFAKGTIPQHLNYPLQRESRT